MGCNASDAGNPHSSAFGGKSPSKDCLNEENKRRFRKIIQKDDIKDFIVTVAELGKPVHSFSYTPQCRDFWARPEVDDDSSGLPLRFQQMSRVSAQELFCRVCFYLYKLRQCSYYRRLLSFAYVRYVEIGEMF